jgi:hypothetical protein
MWTSVICSSFAWHLPVPVRHHTTPLEGGIHPISSLGYQFAGYGWGGNLSYNGLLYPAAWVSTGTTSAPITLSMNRVYVEYLTNN